MITLKVEAYCQNCIDFEPEVDKDGITYECSDFTSSGTRSRTFCETLITCKHAQRCACIKDYIKETNK